jgi:hypothetical protein
VKVIERIHALRQRRPQSRDLKPGGDEVAPQVVTLGLGHCRIEFDQDFARLASRIFLECQRMR